MWIANLGRVLGGFMRFGIIKLGLVTVLAISLAAACGPNKRNRKTTKRPANGAANTQLQKNLNQMDNELKNLKSDPSFSQTSPNQSTTQMAAKASSAYQNALKGKAGESNRSLLTIFEYAEIQTSVNDKSKLTVVVNAYQNSDKQNLRAVFRGDIDVSQGKGNLQADIKDSELAKLSGQKTDDQTDDQVDNPRARGQRTSDKNAVNNNKAKYSGDVLCLDKECYNLLVRIMDNKSGTFLSYFHRLVHVVNSNDLGRIRLTADLVKSMHKNLTSNNRGDDLKESKEDGVNAILVSSATQFDLHMDFTLNMVNHTYSSNIQLTEHGQEHNKAIEGHVASGKFDSNSDEVVLVIQKRNQ